MTGGRRVDLELSLTVDADWTDEAVAQLVSELGALLAAEAFGEYGPDASGGYVGPRLVWPPKFGALVGGEWIAGGGPS